MISERRPLLNVVIVIVVVAAVIGAAVPFVGRILQAARVTKTKDNLRQLCRATADADSTNGRLPPAFGKYAGHLIGVDNGLFLHLLPHVNQQALYHSLSYSKANVPVFMTPLDPSLPNVISAHTSFAGNIRVFSNAGSLQPYRSAVPVAPSMPNYLSLIRTLEASDGTEHTMMFATRYAVCDKAHQRFIGRPDESSGAFFGAGAYDASPASGVVAGGVPAFLTQPGVECDATPSTYAHSMGPQALHVGMCSGTVKQVSPRISPENWARLVCLFDGQQLGADTFE